MITISYVLGVIIGATLGISVWILLEILHIQNTLGDIKLRINEIKKNLNK